MKARKIRASLMAFMILISVITALAQGGTRQTHEEPTINAHP